MKKFSPEWKGISNSILNSYSQVFFSTSKLLAIFLLVISFFDYGAGLGGVIAVLVANLLAWGLGYNRYYLTSGLYGFNALLVGLGVGLFYQPSPELFLLVAVSAVLSFFFTVVFQGVLGKYGLPFLSVPFLFAIWIVALSSGSLTALNISERGIYTYNELYSLGGKDVVIIYDYLENSISSPFWNIYFHSLGAIFFQTQLLAGIIIALGLLIYSRITFVLSLLGFAVAYLFYHLVGIEFSSLGYTFIGFNYILTAIALGGYFLVPGRLSYAWIVLLLPAVVLLTTGSQQIFSTFRISPYSLPFNIIVLVFLYALKLRVKRSEHLVETPVQLGNPEKNLYLHSGNLKRFPAAYPVSASLPFLGEWTVSQAHNGEFTHRGAWQHAWDFIIADRTGNQFKGSGDFPEDYYCYGKIVVAPFDGVVVEAINIIPENRIGDMDTRNNWGNTVVLKNNDYLYAKLCHLKYHSVEVKPGDRIKKGQPLGRCGNSGRSPYPHLHFQFQATPYIGSATLEYPFGHYILKNEKEIVLRSFDFPLKNQIVANPSNNEVLAKTLHFVPGQRLKAEVRVESDDLQWQQLAGTVFWMAETDVYNTTYLRDEKTGAIAYLYNDGDLHYFTNFLGEKRSALFWFFVTFFKIPFGFLPESRVSDVVPLNLMFSGPLKLLQDFVAPLHLFLKVNYSLTMKQAGDILSAGDLVMKAVITKQIFGREAGTFHADLKVTEGNVIEIQLIFNDTRIHITCQNELD